MQCSNFAHAYRYLLGNIKLPNKKYYNSVQIQWVMILFISHRNVPTNACFFTCTWWLVWSQKKLQSVRTLYRIAYKNKSSNSIVKSKSYGRFSDSPFRGGGTSYFWEKMQCSNFAHAYRYVFANIKIKIVFWSMGWPREVRQKFGQI